MTARETVDKEEVLDALTLSQIPHTLLHFTQIFSSALFFLEMFSPVLRPILVPPLVWVKMSRHEVHSQLFSPMFSLSRGSQNH